MKPETNSPLPWGGRSPLVPLLVWILISVPGFLGAQTFEDRRAGLPLDNRGWSCNPFPDGGFTGVAFADVNRDGLDDLGAVGRLQEGLHYWRSAGLGAWTESSSGLDVDCHGRSDVGWSDVNNDGFLDFGGISGINGRPEVFLGNGGSNWTGSSTGLDGGGGEGFCFGDFDGDGNPDLAMTGHLDSGGASAFLGDGTGRWFDCSAGLPTTGGGHKLTSADTDLDGRDELVTTLSFGVASPLQGVSIWKLGKDRAWTIVERLYFDQPWGIDVGDVDNNGRPDIAVGVTQDDVGTYGSIRVFLNNGTDFVESSAGLPSGDGFYTDVALGDMDSDGNLDIVAGTNSGNLRLFPGDGLGGWTEAQGTGLPQGQSTIEGLDVGDMDGDCLLDLAVAAYEDGVQVWRENDPALCPILPDGGPSRTICAGATALLDGSESSICGCAASDRRFRWWADGVLIHDWSSLPTVSRTPAADTAFRVDAACARDLVDCVRSDTVLVEVIPLPAPAIATSPDPPAACPGKPVMLDAGPGFDTYYWETNPPGEDGDTLTTRSISVAPSVRTTYTVTVAVPFGCSGKDSVVVAVLPSPAPVITASPDPPVVCPGQTVMLDAGAGYASYAWATVPAGEPGDNATSRTVAASPSQTTIYTVTVADSAGCLGTDSLEVTVRSAPAPSITSSPDPPNLCPGNEATLTGQAGFATYRWRTSPAGAPGDGSTTPAIAVRPTASTIYTLTVTDAAGCAGSVGIAVVVRTPPTPVVTSTPDPPAVCVGQTLSLDAGSGFATYRWSTAPPGEPGDGSTANPLTVAPLRPTTYSATVTDAAGCTGTATVSCAIVPGPQPDIAVDPPVVCLGDSASLDAGTGFSFYQWSTSPPGQPGDGAGTRTLVVTPTQTTIYTALVFDAKGCAGTDAVLLAVSGSAVPGPVGNSIRLTRENRDARAVWRKLLPLESSGDYQIVYLGEGPLPPDTAHMEGAAVAGSQPNDLLTPDGEYYLGGAVDLSPPLIFYRVRATNPCSGIPGKTGD